jgi:methionyl-tRNA formyltransferase
MTINCMIFGCEQLTVNVVRYISSLQDVTLQLIVTHETLQDSLYGYDSVIDEAEKQGIEVFFKKKINDSLIEKIQDLQPDIILSTFYRNILSKKILGIPSIGCFNIHPGMLPNYRGFSPAMRALLAGEKRFGITIHSMDSKIDTGDIMVQEEFPIDEDETGFELHMRSTALCTKLISENFYKLVNQDLIPIQQTGCGSYYGAIPSPVFINWQTKADSLKNLIRGYAQPFRCLQTSMFNKYFLINRVTVIRDEKHLIQKVGKIVDILDNDRIVVTCIDGHLILEDYEVVPRFKENEKSIYLRIGNVFKQ